MSVWFLFILLHRSVAPTKQPIWFTTKAECVTDAAWTARNLTNHGWPGSLVYCKREKV